MPDLQKLGIVAGAGQFPLLLSQSAREHGVEVYAFAVKELTAPEIEQYSTQTFWLELNDFLTMIQLCMSNGIHHLALAGRIPHKRILDNYSFNQETRSIVDSMPDKTARSIFQVVADRLKTIGIEIISSASFLDHLLVPAGSLTPHRPLTKEEQRDIAFGVPIACQIADLEIGQTVVVKNQLVVAVEALEGTDETLRRGGGLAGKGFVVIKAARPQQDPRFDLPIIGLRTLHLMSELGGTTLAVSANKTLFFDKDAALELAGKHEIAVVGI